MQAVQVYSMLLCLACGDLPYLSLGRRFRYGQMQCGKEYWGYHTGGNLSSGQEPLRRPGHGRQCLGVDAASLDEEGQPYRVVRGGSWIDVPGGARCAIRSWYDQRLRDDDLGERVSRILQPLVLEFFNP